MKFVVHPPALEHRKFGIFVASGPNIRKNSKVYGMSLIDVAPTILHHFNLPIGKDMDGKPSLEIFEKPSKPTYIDSWDAIEGDFGEHKGALANTSLSDQEAMEQLIELGYIERPDEKIEKAIHKTKCDLEHNLARVYLGKKDFNRAKEILLDLVKDTEVDTIPFFMDLMNISIQENEYQLVEKYLTKLRELDKNFIVNTKLIEAKILIHKGQLHQASELLEKVAEKSSSFSILMELGNTYFSLKNFDKSLSAYRKAQKIESDNAQLHLRMCQVLYQLEAYEEAADHTLMSIELVRYIPEAHFMLGRCLEKLGDIENAQIAFETAKNLRPKMHKADHALENIRVKQELLKKPTAETIPNGNEIILVSGLPRSGTSMMMQMLNASGLSLLTDNKRLADDANPKGYYEYEPVMSLRNDNSWLTLAKNKVVKVVAPLLKHTDTKYRYKVIFMQRNIYEIITSQQIMLKKDTNVLPLKLKSSYERQLEDVKMWEHNHPGVDIHYVEYKDVLENTNDVVNDIQSFLARDLDLEKMKSCVDKTLYRNKS